MTKNRKIKLLINDNIRLSEENKKLHELNNEEISKKIVAEPSNTREIEVPSFGFRVLVVKEFSNTVRGCSETDLLEF